MEILIENLEKNFDNENVKNMLPFFTPKISINDYKKYIFINENKYNKKLIYSSPTKNFDLYIITWSPLQKSPIHNHPSNGCILKVLEGKIKETIYNNTGSKKLQKNYYKKGDVSYMDDNKGTHKIKNKDIISVSLHFYSPKNYKCKIIKA